MARTGRPAKPTTLKVLEGRAKESDKSKEPQPLPVTPERPDYLSPVAVEEWDRVVPELERLGLLTIVDGGALAAYCESYALFVAAAIDVRERGPLIPGQRGRGELVRNPSVQSMRDAAATMRSYASEFGLTPQARARMVLPGDDDTANEIEELFSRVGRGVPSARKPS